MTTPNHHKPASAADKLKCVGIIDKIDKHIPLRGYVAPVQAVLEGQGHDYSNSQITNTRLKRNFHLPIVLALQELYDPDYKPAGGGDIIRRQKLNVPADRQAS